MERRYHHGALREALLDTAERMAVSDGVGALTLRAVAREAGVTHGSPKHHFRDFAALLSAVAGRGFARLAAAMAAEAARRGENEDERRRGLGIAYVTFALENASLFQLMFRSDQLDAKDPTLSSAREAAFTLLAGADPDQQATIRAIRSWTRVHGFALLMIDGQLGSLQVHAGLDGMELAHAVLGD